MKAKLVRAGATACLIFAICTIAASVAAAETLPSGFQDTPVWTGLEEPTAIRFSPDGRVFVATKAGQILLFDGVGDESPTVFADLRAQVYDNGDRGLLGLALAPGFPAKPFVYALYTFDHVPGEDDPGEYPRWGQPPDYAGDPCPKPESADVDACPVSGRLLRLTAEGNHAAAEEVLVEDWCQQTSSHSIGDLQFGPEGALFASGGDGASFLSSDYGQFGWPQKNQCGDPPGGIGVALEPPEAEGGSLRAQDVRTPEDPLTHSDPTSLDGSLIRIDPETGAGLADNPMGSSADPNARRIIAYGFRNPFRFSINPKTDEVYVDNVGNGTDEEIDRFSTVPDQAYNSGWPCYEGSLPNSGFQALELDLCESLYEEPGATSMPFFSYVHEQPVIPEDDCLSDFGSAISGSTFYEGGSFPPSYDDAFFFADPVRGCIYVMYAGEDGRPDPSTTAQFLRLNNAGLYPGVDIEVGPEGDLYYIRLFGNEYGPGSIQRVSYFSGNQPPVARLTATPQWGADPLNAGFNATGSSDPDGEQLSYEWDPQGDGTYEASTSNGEISRKFTDTENHTIAVRVSDEEGANRIARVTVYPGDTPPQPVIVAPGESEPGSGQADTLWAVGQAIDFEGVAHDGEDGDLADADLDWSSRLYHCPASCHAHPLQAFPGAGAGTLIAPDHDYPSHLELTLTATDSRGLSARKAVTIYPRTVELGLSSNPPGLTLTAGLLTEEAPFTLTAIEGSHVTLSAPQTARRDGLAYAWQGWSDGGARVHSILASASREYVASYAPIGGPAGLSPRPGGPPARLQTLLRGHPKKRAVSSTARFRFSAQPAAVRFRCKLDGGPLRACRSPRTYRGLQPGRHVFRVAVVDSSGNADPTPALFRWRVLGAQP